MRNTLFMTLTFAASIAVANPSHAADCGQPPYIAPEVPASADNITIDSLRDIRSAVVSYSANVDRYLTCMDREGEKLTRFMTKSQQTRRDEDLNAIHERRREVQIQINELIRAYRERENL